MALYFGLAISFQLINIAAANEAAGTPVGVARIDILPLQPVHIINELEDQRASEVESPLFARAIAIGAATPAVLIAYDGIGVTAAIR